MGSIIFGGLLARRGAGACLLWLLAGRGAGHWGVLAGGSPARRLLLAWSRRVRAAARRSGHCRAWGSVSRALGPIDVCRAEPSISLPAPAGGRLVSFASEAWFEPHETSRRGLRRGSEPCFDAELHIERRAWRCARG